jgi:hypothetical protein
LIQVVCSWVHGWSAWEPDDGCLEKQFFFFALLEIEVLTVMSAGAEHVDFFPKKHVVDVLFRDAGNKKPFILKKYPASHSLSSLGMPHFAFHEYSSFTVFFLRGILSVIHECLLSL